MFVSAQNRVDSLFTKYPELKGIFTSNKKQHFGFYANYDFEKDNLPFFYKSIGENQSDVVNFHISPKHLNALNLLSFESDSVTLHPVQVQPTIFHIHLPKRTHDYSISVNYKGELIAVLNVVVLPEKTQKILLVPLVKTKINTDSLKRQLDKKFQSANMHFDIQLAPLFSIKDKTPFKNPESSRLKYTSQMTHLRDDYFKKNTVNNHLIFFIVPDFEDTLIDGFMVKNKALGFISKRAESYFSQVIAHEYLYGFINSAYLLDTLSSKRRLTNRQWLEVNENPSVFSYLDDYEDVVTNNGLIAYYLWEEDADGNIVLQNGDFLSSILRPIKKNTFSYHLQITSFLYKTLFTIKSKPFNSLHLFSALTLLIGLSFVFIWFRKKIKNKFKRTRFINFSSRLIEWGIMSVSIWLAILLVDKGYYFFEIKEGVITSYNGLSKEQVLDELITNKHPKKIEENYLGSEVVVQKGSEYSLHELKRVLHFQLQVNPDGKGKKLKLLSSSDVLKTPLISGAVLAESHYIVVSVISENGTWLRDEIYNHLGVNLSDKVALEDPPKRILLFVNGYRPTSLGRSFAENFADIQQHGMEFPNSLNRIFTSDRYNYWHPWGEIDALFKNRINPTESYYADGHHSVATSNHRSVLKFATASQEYPSRCSDKHHHTCQTTKTFDLGLFGSNYINTYKLLATSPNRDGFKLRENAGRIAGRNLFQLLNELPNTSKNDTLFIIAHSMGFAYAQGIINQIRGGIQLGGLYIIAPENASSGRVNPDEWKEIWQYGSNLGQKNQDAPCLQDGVAPQAAVGGLDWKHLVFIPRDKYTIKGFFDSHFIGYYKWILDIPKGKKGNIRGN